MKTNNFPGKKSIALLLDPDKAKGDSLKNILKIAEECKTDYILQEEASLSTILIYLIDTCKRTMLQYLLFFSRETCFSLPIKQISFCSFLLFQDEILNYL